MLKALGSRLTYSNVMATGAMFVALGGGAYALTGIPDSGGVFHGCVSNGNGALRVVRRASSCQKATARGRHRTPGELAIAWNQQGRQGLQGIPGLQGQPGAKGDKGDPGAQGPPGPTTAAVSGGSAPPACNPCSGAPVAPTTIVTTTSGAVFVQGLDANAELQCTTGSCTGHWGLYLDGQPIPGSDVILTQGSGVDTKAIVVHPYGIASNVPAGTHTVDFRRSITGPGNIFMSFAATTAAIALGG